MHPILQPRGEPNLGVLLIQFFELYGKNFNYQALGISIRSNGRYYQKLPLPLLSIEDPQDPGSFDLFIFFIFYFSETFISRTVQK